MCWSTWVWSCVVLLNLSLHIVHWYWLGLWDVKWIFIASKVWNCDVHEGHWCWIRESPCLRWMCFFNALLDKFVLLHLSHAIDLVPLCVSICLWSMPLFANLLIHNWHFYFLGMCIFRWIFNTTKLLNLAEQEGHWCCLEFPFSIVICWK